MLIDQKDNTWLLSFDYGNLNRIGSPDSANTVAQVKTRLRTAELSYRRGIALGEILTGIGYDYQKNTVTDESDGDFQFYLQWSVDY